VIDRARAGLSAPVAVAAPHPPASVEPPLPG